MAAGEFEAFIHVGLKDRRAGQGIIQLLMGVAAVLLILDEPGGAMQFADIVIEGSRADQVDIGLDRPRALFRQPTDHQRVLEGAGGFGGESAQQRSLQIGQLHQPCPGEQAEEALH